MLWTVALLAALAGAWAGGRGVGLMARALRDADDPRSSLALIRGVRGLVLAVAAWTLAAGLLLDQWGLLAFGAIFLAEELYETGLVALVLRDDLKRHERGAAGGAAVS
jgi:hypothetical protein